MRRIKKLFGLLGSKSGVPGTSNMRVFRVEGAPEVTHVLEREIVRLCDGRSVRRLIADVYSQELRKGGWVADIGMWKDLFAQDVVSTIARLEQQNIIRVESNQRAAGKEDGPALSGPLA